MTGHGDHGHDVSHSRKSASAENLQKILNRAATQKFSESPKYVADLYSGVMPASIAGRFENERARLGPDFNETQRQWRIKWHQDQNLHPSEPFEVPNLLKENLNPIRRFYRFPMDIVENALCTVMRKSRASIARKAIGRGFIAYCGFLYFWYELNYNTATWEKYRGIRVHTTREAVFPGDIRYPMPNPRTESWEHYDRGFHKRKVLLDN